MTAPDPTDVLARIAEGGCENFTGPGKWSCFHHGREAFARYGADAACYPCIAHQAVENEALRSVGEVAAEAIAERARNFRGDLFTEEAARLLDHIVGTSRPTQYDGGGCLICAQVATDRDDALNELEAIRAERVGEVAVLQAAEAESDTRWTLLVNLIEALDRCGVIFEDRSVIDAITAARNYVEDGVIPAVAGLVEAETPEEETP